MDPATMAMLGEATKGSDGKKLNITNLFKDTKGLVNDFLNMFKGKKNDQQNNQNASVEAAALAERRRLEGEAILAQYSKPSSPERKALRFEGKDDFMYAHLQPSLLEKPVNIAGMSIQPKQALWAIPIIIVGGLAAPFITGKKKLKL
ncbi:MAG: hypothetical protein EOP56_13585 [Sphingobacteriales bacterium]|nr:MAG: hypothetical protein EOP56_13585 [Sphingobacteriales bacterium]